MPSFNLNKLFPVALAVVTFVAGAGLGYSLGYDHGFERAANPQQIAVPPLPPGAVGDGCVRAGCSSHLCVDEREASDIVTTCEYRAEYTCFATARCERQKDGNCSWTETPELTSCIKNPPPIE